VRMGGEGLLPILRGKKAEAAIAGQGEENCHKIRMGGKRRERGKFDLIMKKKRVQKTEM